MIRPLNETKILTAEGALNRKPKSQSIVANTTPRTPETVTSQLGSIVPHSAHAAQRSHEYHKAIRATHTGGRQSSARMTDQLNPDSSVSEDAATQGRRFPGLANG